MRTYRQAVAYAEAQHRRPSAKVRRGGMCQWFSRQCVGAGPFGLTAYQAWRNTPASHRHTRGTPPPGSLFYWRGGSRGYGHVAFVVENGYVWSTDILHPGRVDKVHYTQIQKRWGQTPLGWIDWTPSGNLPILSSVKPKPVVHVSRVQPGAKNGEVLVMQKALHVEPGISLDYSSAPGTMGPKTQAAYQKWQRKLGFTSSDADGKPGISSLTELGRRHGFLGAP